MKQTVELSVRHLKDPEFGKPPKKSNENVLQLAAPHIDSFNFFLDKGIDSLQELPSVQFALSCGDQVSVSIESLEVGQPTIPDFYTNTRTRKLYPKECIERKCTYNAPMTGKVVWKVNDRLYSPIPIKLGNIPIMIKSNKCHLNKMTPEELIKNGEIANETGGYFIINGGCRVLRLLIANRRNYPIAMNRKTWKSRDLHFSEKGILMRCVGQDQTASVLILHHLTTGGVKIEFQIERELFFLPLMMLLKTLCSYSDRVIFKHLINGREDDTYFVEKVKMMMRELQEKKLLNRTSCKKYMGRSFREKLVNVVPPWFSDEDICDYMLDHFILIHLKKNASKSKFHTLCMMTRKLYCFVSDKCVVESVDVVSMQEASLGGHTFLQLVKEKLQMAVTSMKYNIMAKNKEQKDNYRISDADMNSVTLKIPKFGDQLQTFIATGSLKSKNRCGLMQDTGLTVMMDKLNRMRDLSHLRAIHRGAYFLDMKTIGPRRLTGEAWGFICPVHTPDGAPCGLLNHLSNDCKIPAIPIDVTSSKSLLNYLFNYGVTGVEAPPVKPYSKSYEVIVDGELVGYVNKSAAANLVFMLRYCKVIGKIYQYTEIVLIEERECLSQYPCLVIATSESRLMRPVLHKQFGRKEFIGTLEQNYLNIAVSKEDFDESIHSHVDLCETTMLSNIGRLVPFSDCNPNPRNMYQCQMGKQTMGTPIHNWENQTFSKLYRLQYPQIPLIRNSHYDDINMEEFCMGFNACLAIVSYTGYDMEDAMVINKCAMERGLGHGQVYKSEMVDLAQMRHSRMSSNIEHIFARDPAKADLSNFLDEYGLPQPGTKMENGDPYYCILKRHDNSFRVTKYKGEPCVVDKYSFVNCGTSKTYESFPQQAIITIRIQRYPIIGDKFASRSGQKGVMSRLYPIEDLPFNERGIVPDIIFNPHGIPSRMTAGTLIEVMAGKCAAEFGKSFDSTPFAFSDERPAVDYYGEILEKAGFNYYGEDVLYSGTDGRMMEVRVFEGIVYYQRLRHMTADKWQVRAQGPVDPITRQPIKGRKRGGAIRFGEMERDCLISHGAPYLLLDRLLYCSDASKEWICSKCSSLLSPLITSRYNRTPQCSNCGPETKMVTVEMPYSFKYLVTEFASVGIKTNLKVNTWDIKIPYPKIRLKNVNLKASFN